jgi:hypothetical protein
VTTTLADFEQVFCRYFVYPEPVALSYELYEPDYPVEGFCVPHLALNYTGSGGVITGTVLRSARFYLLPDLFRAPAGALEYVAASYALWLGPNPYPYPDRHQMGIIRKLWAQTGDYPFPGSSRQAYHQVTLDKQTRMFTPYRLTDELAQWLDAADTQIDFPSWRGRFVVQEHDRQIWTE